MATVCARTGSSAQPYAVRILRDHRSPARRLRDGFPEWQRAGLPVTVGAVS